MPFPPAFSTVGEVASGVAIRGVPPFTREGKRELRGGVYPIAFEGRAIGIVISALVGTGKVPHGVSRTEGGGENSAGIRRLRGIDQAGCDVAPAKESS